jgi:ferredoxin
MIYRNRKLLDVIRQSPCQACGRADGTIVAAHSNQLRDGKGRGIKAHDYRIAALCHSCHSEIDQGAKLSKAERIETWEEAHRKTIGWLFENNHIKTQ